MEHFIAPERFETDRFTVRRYEPGDGPLLAEAANASYAHLEPWMPWARPHQSVEAAEVTARRFCGKHLLAEDFVMAIVSPDGGKLLGGTGFHLRHGGGVSERDAEIGMWIRGDTAGQGLGTAVLEALLEWGFTAWPWERLTWHCDATNLASARTAQKAGLRLEGTLRQHASVKGRRDTLLFAILRDEWLATRA